MTLPPPPPLPGRDRFFGDLDGPSENAPAAPSRSEQKQDLRERNALRVQELVGRTGMEHKLVNNRLNQEAGIDRITQATIPQLERRLKAAEKWVSQLTGR